MITPLKYMLKNYLPTLFFKKGLSLLSLFCSLCFFPVTAEAEKGIKTKVSPLKSATPLLKAAPKAQAQLPVLDKAATPLLTAHIKQAPSSDQKASPTPSKTEISHQQSRIKEDTKNLTKTEADLAQTLATPKKDIGIVSNDKITLHQDTQNLTGTKVAVEKTQHVVQTTQEHLQNAAHQTIKANESFSPTKAQVSSLKNTVTTLHTAVLKEAQPNTSALEAARKALNGTQKNLTAVENLGKAYAEEAAQTNKELIREEKTKETLTTQITQDTTSLSLNAASIAHEKDSLPIAPPSSEKERPLPPSPESGISPQKEVPAKNVTPLQALEKIHAQDLLDLSTLNDSLSSTRKDITQNTLKYQYALAFSTAINQAVQPEIKTLSEAKGQLTLLDEKAAQFDVDPLQTEATLSLVQKAVNMGASLFAKVKQLPQTFAQQAQTLLQKTQQTDATDQAHLNAMDQISSNAKQIASWQTYLLEITGKNKDYWKKEDPYWYAHYRQANLNGNTYEIHLHSQSIQQEAGSLEGLLPKSFQNSVSHLATNANSIDTLQGDLDSALQYKSYWLSHNPAWYNTSVNTQKKERNTAYKSILNTAQSLENISSSSLFSKTTSNLSAAEASLKQETLDAHYDTQMAAEASVHGEALRDLQSHVQTLESKLLSAQKALEKASLQQEALKKQYDDQLSHSSIMNASALDKIQTHVQDLGSQLTKAQTALSILQAKEKSQEELLSQHTLAQNTLKQQLETAQIQLKDLLMQKDKQTQKISEAEASLANAEQRLVIAQKNDAPNAQKVQDLQSQVEQLKSKLSEDEVILKSPQEKPLSTPTSPPVMEKSDQASEEKEDALGDEKDDTRVEKRQDMTGGFMPIPGLGGLIGAEAVTGDQTTN